MKGKMTSVGMKGIGNHNGGFGEFTEQGGFEILDSPTLSVLCSARTLGVGLRQPCWLSCIPVAAHSPDRHQAPVCPIRWLGPLLASTIAGGDAAGNTMGTPT